MTANRRIGRVPEDTLRGSIPALDDAVERFAMMASSEDSTIAASSRAVCSRAALSFSIFLCVLTSRKNQNASGDVAAVVRDWSSAVVNRALTAVLSYEDGVIGEPDDDPVPKGLGCRVFNGKARVFVDDSKHRVKVDDPQPGVVSSR